MKVKDQQKTDPGKDMDNSRGKKNENNNSGKIIRVKRLQVDSAVT